MTARPDHEDGQADEQLLAALADGSLDETRRRALEERVAASSHLTAQLAEQRRALELVHGAAAQVEAPARLRARIEARRRPSQRRRWAVTGGLAVAAAAIILIVFAALPTGTAGPTVVEAETIGTLAPNAAAPPVDPSQPKLLQAQVEGVSFPAWATKFGWHAVGSRSGTFKGRPVLTVYYSKQGKTIAYTIVGGSALKEPASATSTTREGTVVKVFSAGNRTAVTWKRQGRTCILSGVGVAEAVLVKLAAWHGKGAVPF
jgi:hypothetical protein